MKKLFIGVVALGLSPLALAGGPPPAPAFNPGVYLGVQAGYGMTHWDDFFGSAIKDEDGFAGRLFVGYDFHPNFAIEAGYTMWFTKPKLLGAKFDYPWAIDLVGKIKAHVVDNFGLYAKAGGDYIYQDFGSTIGGHADNFNVVYGVGAFYDITPNINVDLSWTRYHGDQDLTDSDRMPFMDLFALGFSYKFDF
jgi:OOP family OmpA-OmpF porin